MTTINTSFPPMGLAHSLNSRGELGMFVNPYSCSCTTCHDYLTDHDDKAAPPLPPSPPPSPSPLFSLANLSNEIAIIEKKLEGGMTFSQKADWERLLIPRKRALQQADTEAADALMMMSRSSMPDTRCETPPRLVPPPSLRFSPPPILRSMTGFHYVPSDRHDTGTLPASPPSSVAEEIVLKAAQAKIIYDGMTDYIQMLRTQQDKIYDTPCHSHDEMAAQDMEFEELDRKIAEMDDILQTLHE
jgi:hypothetical protein